MSVPSTPPPGPGHGHAYAFNTAQTDEKFIITICTGEREGRNGNCKKKRLTGGSLMWTERFRVWGANGSLLVAQ